MNDKIKAKVGSYLAVTGSNKCDIAQSLGISDGAFYCKLTGITEFKWSEICKLGEILGCSVADFVEEKTTDD